MKHLLYLLVIVLCTLFSCSSEFNNLKIEDNNDQEKKELKSIIYKGNYILDNNRGFYIAPGLEWWHNREGSFYCYLYDVYYNDYPYSVYSPNDYFYYISILWNGYPPYHYYNFSDYKIQVQYRFRRYGYDQDDWKYPEGLANINGSPYKTYGIYNILADEEPLDLNATSFAYGYLEFRIRMVHKDFPGPNIGTSLAPKYDEKLVSRWAYGGSTINNIYGFGSPMLGDSNIGVNGRIKINVNIPSSFTYDYSYSVSFGEYSTDINLIAGGINGYYWKPAKTGKINVIAQKRDNSFTPAKIKTTSKSATYGAGTGDLTFNFSESDF